MSDGRKTHYDTLGVARDASPQTIQATYRKRIREVHPDTAPGSHDHVFAMLQAETQRLNEAYAVLSDPEKRHAYDLSLVDPDAPQRGYVHRYQAPPTEIDPRVRRWILAAVILFVVMAMIPLFALSGDSPTRHTPTPNPSPSVSATP